MHSESLSAAAVPPALDATRKLMQAVDLLPDSAD
jgi:hypothetical protein